MNRERLTGLGGMFIVVPSLLLGCSSSNECPPRADLVIGFSEEAAVDQFDNFGEQELYPFLQEVLHHDFDYLTTSEVQRSWQLFVDRPLGGSERQQIRAAFDGDPAIDRVEFDRPVTATDVFLPTCE